MSVFPEDNMPRNLLYLEDLIKEKGLVMQCIFQLKNVSKSCLLTKKSSINSWRNPSNGQMMRKKYQVSLQVSHSYAPSQLKKKEMKKKNVLFRCLISRCI